MVLHLTRMLRITHTGGNLVPDFSNAVDWYDFVSDIAQGNYDHLEAEKCIKLGKFGQGQWTKVIVALTNELCVSKGGDAAMLSTAVLSGHSIFENNHLSPSISLALIEPIIIHMTTSHRKPVLTAWATPHAQVCNLITWAQIHGVHPALARVNEYANSHIIRYHRKRLCHILRMRLATLCRVL